VDGVSYLQFLASGSIAMSVMYSAKFESLWGAFTRMNIQKTWDAILHTPLAVDDLLLGEIIWAASKATFTALCILVMIWVLDIARAPLSLLVLPAAFFIALVFSSMALIVNAVARSYDLLSNYFTVVVMPLVFLSGVYFPLTQLPGWLRPVAEFLPMTAAVNLVRPLALGNWPGDALRDVLLLSVWGAVCFTLALGLTRRRLLK
jgi:lipooligosaccharide transport system permease protein